MSDVRTIINSTQHVSDFFVIISKIAVIVFSDVY